VPAEWAKSWCGTEASPGSGNDDDPVRTDYDRACGKLRALHRSSYGGVGCLTVGKGNALVFTAPTDTTFVALADGGAFLRNVKFTNARAARAAVDAAPKWKKTRAEIDLRDGRIFVFDAAYPYPGAVKSALGRPDIMTAQLKRGRYRVFACDYRPEGAGDYELHAYRLVRASAAS
jgi:hypothetical protein